MSSNRQLSNEGDPVRRREDLGRFKMIIRSGPKQPVKNLKVYNRPSNREIKQLPWRDSRQDSFLKQTFSMKPTVLVVVAKQKYIC